MCNKQAEDRPMYMKVRLSEFGTGNLPLRINSHICICVHIEEFEF